MKTREFKDKNYRAIYINGKTLRIALDSSKPILDLDYPEFLDIKLNSNCNANCSYCYQSSCIDSWNGSDSYDKLKKFFISMTRNQKPFQIAYGGGEPTLNPRFADIMKMTREFGIAPNYTTNGMFIIEDNYKEIIQATKDYCEGVAITCHSHLEAYWSSCADLFIEEDIFTNFHHLIDDEDSVDDFLEIYNKYKGKIKYFVLLPVLNEGRAKGLNLEKNYDYLFSRLSELKDIEDIAFGAKFHPFLKPHKFLDLSLYEPEIMSKYLDLENNKLYKSSFDVEDHLRILDLE